MFEHFKSWSNECTLKRETRRLVISLGILLILGIALYLLNPILKRANTAVMLLGPVHLTRTYLLPLFCLILGWTLMQGSGVLGLVKKEKPKARKPIHITMLVILLLYVVIMLPNAIFMIKCTVMELQYMRDPTLFPGGIDISWPAIPFLSDITLSIIGIVFNQPVLFIIPGVILWLSEPEKRKRHPRT